MKRFAVIMGASGAIGEAIANQLASDGWSLYLHWNSTPVNGLAEELSRNFTKQEFIAVQADFTRTDGAERLAT